MNMRVPVDGVDKGLNLSACDAQAGGADHARNRSGLRIVMRTTTIKGFIEHAHSGNVCDLKHLPAARARFAVSPRLITTQDGISSRTYAMTERLDEWVWLKL